MASDSTRRAFVDRAWHDLRERRTPSYLLTPGLIESELRRVQTYGKALADLLNEQPPIVHEGQMSIV